MPGRLAGRRGHAVVGNLDRQSAGLVAEGDSRRGGKAGVLAGVSQGFLYDPVGGQFRAFGQLPGDAGQGVGDLEPGGPGLIE